MDTVPGLARLQARKRELLLESELNRQLLRLEVGSLTFRAGQFKRGFGWAKNVWKWAAPVAGFLLARKLKNKPAGIFTKGSMLVSGLRAAWKILETFQRKCPGSDTGA